MTKLSKAYSSVAVALAGLVACSTPKPLATVELRPLAPLSVQPIIVFPVQYLSFHDSLGWGKAVPKQGEYLAGLDDEIAYALGERGLGAKWTFAPDITRIARRNSTVVSDPRALSSEQLRAPLRVDEHLEEPLGSQIRSVLALKEGRFVLLPIDVDFRGAGPGSGVAVLRIVMLDAKLANVKWVGEVRSDPATMFSPALAASLASRFADLILPRPH